jgi:hypothetical protein
LTTVPKFDVCLTNSVQTLIIAKVDPDLAYSRLHEFHPRQCQHRCAGISCEISFIDIHLYIHLEWLGALHAACSQSSATTRSVPALARRCPLATHSRPQRAARRAMSSTVFDPSIQFGVPTIDEVTCFSRMPGLRCQGLSEVQYIGQSERPVLLPCHLQCYRCESLTSNSGGSSDCAAHHHRDVSRLRDVSPPGRDGFTPHYRRAAARGDGGVGSGVQAGHFRDRDVSASRPGVG